ncbi:hypothetical protein ALC53_13432 [Atta colombica]|uniref:Reverse transcriptase domain-containing protein n=1 Tax=Atta colombica TaxID=520822 RepID=A0A151HXW5_9HYME|nr:hypothetical protein ALC53_13432 [Atta colombica]
MDLVLTGLQGEELFVYMDIVSYVSSLKEYEKKYNLLIEQLRKVDLKLQPNKCETEFLENAIIGETHCLSREYLQMGHIRIIELRSNQIDFRTATLVGQMDNDGSTITIMLLDYHATVRLNTNQIMLRSGVICEFASTHCMDIEGGNTYTIRAYDHIIYTLNSQDTDIFVLTKKGIETICHILKPENLDIFTYMNSKFVYMEKHIRNQINISYTEMYNNLEQKILKNALALATHSPDAFAYVMQRPRYMALLVGEIIHMVYWFTPRPVETLPPVVFKPMTKSTWKYISPGSLAANDIYSDNDDLETLRDHIMFPAERPSVLNTITQGMGQPGFVNGSSFSNLLDEALIEKIAMSAWEKFWNRFLIFGNALEEELIDELTRRMTRIDSYFYYPITLTWTKWLRSKKDESGKEMSSPKFKKEYGREIKNVKDILISLGYAQ